MCINRAESLNKIVIQLYIKSLYCLVQKDGTRYLLWVKNAASSKMQLTTQLFWTRQYAIHKFELQDAVDHSLTTRGLWILWPCLQILLLREEPASWQFNNNEEIRIKEGDTIMTSLDHILNYISQTNFPFLFQINFVSTFVSNQLEHANYSTTKIF